MISGERDDRLDEMAVGLVELVLIPGLKTLHQRHLLAVVVDDIAHDQYEGGILAFCQEILHGDAHRVLRAWMLDPADIAQDEEADPVARVRDTQMGWLHPRRSVWFRQRFGIGRRLIAFQRRVHRPARETEATWH